MAKKNEEGSWIILIVFFAATVLTLIYLLSSACYLVAWTYFEIKCIILGKADNANDFDLTLEEKSELAEKEKRLAQISNTISSVFEKGEHLSKRQDGYFQARSKLAKELNAYLEKLLPEEETCQDHVDHLNGLPNERKSKWVFNNSMKNSFRIGFPIYVTSIIVFSKYYIPEWVISTGVWVKENSIIEFFDLPSIYYGALLPSILITLLFATSIFFTSILSYKRKFI